MTGVRETVVSWLKAVPQGLRHPKMLEELIKDTEMAEVWEV